MKELKENYEKCIDQYVELFCEKHEADSNGWVADIKGGIIDIGDCCFNFDDIVLDINSNAPKEDGNSIFDWYWENVETTKNQINYYSYIRGLRVSQIIKE